MTFTAAQIALMIQGKVEGNPAAAVGAFGKIEEAKDLGLVQKVFETKAEMLNHAAEVFSTIRSKSALIISKCKEVIREGESLSIENGLKIEKAAFKYVFGTADKAEGIKAFLEKRPAAFKNK